MPYLIPDDPIIRCIERTGYPPWYFWGDDDDGEEDEADDVYYGNESSTF